MEEWGLGPEDLEKINSELIYTRISGYGQTGPYSKLPGFASVCEAVGGFRYVNGFPDRPSVRPNLSMGDTMAGLQGVIGILLALQARNGNKRGGVQSSGKGQVVDVAIYESVFSLLEGVVSEYDGANVTRGCSGSTLTGIVPSNLYRGSDGKDIIIGANGDSLYSRLLDAMGVPKEDELRTWDSNAKRVENQDIIDAKIGEWVGMRSTEETLQILAKAKIPSGLIYSVEDMVTDPHYIARGQFEEVKIEELDRDLKIPAIGPRLTSTPGSTKHPGRSRPGQDSKEVLQEWLGMTDADITDLINSKAVIQND
uniref:Formyl-CoA transferase n=1 Tax=Lotharella globosa TaxID=91324 RepID=A0A7S3Z3G0_9EUKA